MSIDFACDCGRKFSVDNAHAGKRGRCPACKQVIRIPVGQPGSVWDVVIDQVQAVQPPPTDPPASAVVVSVSPTDAATSPHWTVAPLNWRPPHEPWYYRFLFGYAIVIVAMGLGQFFFILVSAIRILIRDGNIVDSSLMLFVWRTSVILSGGVLFVALLIGAPIMLAVNAARDLRAIRFGAVGDGWARSGR